nr:hypothetical protein GCM10020092_064590 [Actinoplanes digitatis]
MSHDVDGVRCMQMRGGSSKGAYFLADDLPADPGERDDLLLRIMGSPDERQVDGIGGGHPLTSKVAVVRPSRDAGADVDYLFLQVVPGRPIVTDAQTCGNLLAGVGPFAIERGLVAASGETTGVRIRIMNPTVGFADARVRTPGGRVRYDGDTLMAGTPFPAAGIRLEFPGGDAPLFPTGRLVDQFAGCRGNLREQPACRWCWCAPPTWVSRATNRRTRSRATAACGPRSRPSGSPRAPRWATAMSGTPPFRRSPSCPRRGGAAR